jgi:hypothetical protein
MAYADLLPTWARQRASKQRQTYKIAFRNQNTSQNPGAGQDGTAKVKKFPKEQAAAQVLKLRRGWIRQNPEYGGAKWCPRLETGRQLSQNLGLVVL